MRIAYFKNDSGNNRQNHFVYIMDNGDIQFYSYTTHCATLHNGAVIRHWSGKSMTTMRHFRHFLEEYDYNGAWNSFKTVGKYWDSLSVVRN